MGTSVWFVLTEMIISVDHVNTFRKKTLTRDDNQVLILL